METFELKRSADGKYFFTFRASSGQPIADSMRYESRRRALDAIEQIRRRARDALIDDRTGDPPGIAGSAADG